MCPKLVGNSQLHITVLYLQFCHFIHTLLQACKLALDEGWAINIGGGFNHYSVNKRFAGLHIYDDVLMCLAVS